MLKRSSKKFRKVKNRKGTKNLRFPAPTQLLMKGQWWSKTLTHLLQMLQCRDLLGLRIKQSGQIFVASYSPSYLTAKVVSLFLKENPGSSHHDRIKKAIISGYVIKLAYLTSIIGISKKSKISKFYKQFQYYSNLASQLERRLLLL